MLFALVLAEVGLRLRSIRFAAIRAGLEDQHFHHRLRPNQTYHYGSKEFAVDIRTNRYGLRGPEPVVPKPEGTFRILMLGDSFTFGFPVKDPEVFSAIIEQQLKAQGLQVDVVNGGVSGDSPTLHYVSLRDQYLEFDPDLVVLWYDLGDLQEDHWYQKNLLYDEAGRIVRCDPRYINGRFSWSEWLTKRSALAKYLHAKVIRSVQKIQVLGLGGYVRAKLRGERAKVAIARLKASQQSEDLGAHDRFLLVRNSLTPEQLERSWGLSRSYLIMIRDLLAERGIGFAVGIYPYGMVAGPEEWTHGRTFWGFDDGKLYDAGQMVSMFSRFSDVTGVPLINTFDSFRQAAGKDKLFYGWDGHMTPAGHEILAAHFTADPRLRQWLSRGTDN